MFANINVINTYSPNLLSAVIEAVNKIVALHSARNTLDMVMSLKPPNTLTE